MPTYPAYFSVTVTLYTHFFLCRIQVCFMHRCTRFMSMFLGVGVVKRTISPPIPPKTCAYFARHSYVYFQPVSVVKVFQRSLQNNILSNIEELKMLKKNNTIMCDTYIRLYYNSFHSAAFITNILYRDQGFLKLNSPVHL